jgi:hypothetical protein
MRRAQIWSKKAKRDHDRLKREIAEKRAEARGESEDRQEGIKARWDLDEQQLRAAKNPKERKLKEQELKAKKLKELLKSVRDSMGNDDLVDRVSELIELAGLQDREIQYLAQFRRDWERIQAYDPDLLESLNFQSLFAQLRPLTGKLLAGEKPKKAWESMRGGYHWAGAGVGLIEYEFGGIGEAEWRKSSLSGALGLPYEPTCLDEIFAGGRVHMDNSEREVVFLGQGRCRILNPGLQLLFGLHRNRFPKNLRSSEDHRNRRERLYDYRAVVKIMDALLREERPKEKSSSRGRPGTQWLRNPQDPDLRRRVLSGIEVRLNSISVARKIRRAFLRALIPPDSAKK